MVFDGQGGGEKEGKGRSEGRGGREGEVYANGVEEGKKKGGREKKGEDFTGGKKSISEVFDV